MTTQLPRGGVVRRIHRWMAPLTALAVTATLLVGIQPTAVSAHSQGGSVATPKQRSGSAAGKPHKVPTSATRKPSDPAVPTVKAKHLPGRGENAAAGADHSSQHDLLKNATVAAKGAASGSATVTAAGPERSRGEFDPATSVEVPAKRTASTDTFRNADGTYVLKVSSGRLNYQKPDGSWAPLDETLVPSGSGWTQKADSEKVAFAADSDAAVLMSLTDGRNTLGFGLSGAYRVAGAAAGQEVAYPGVAAKSDLHLYTTVSGIKEEMILHDASAPTVWTFPLTMSAGLSAAVDAGGDLVVTDSAKNAVFRVPAGYMTDAKTDRATGQGATSTKITYALVAAPGGGKALQVTLDAAWLHDPSRVFPVTVDPTTKIQVPALYTAAWNASGSPTFKWGGYGGQTAVGSPYGSPGSANTSMLILPTNSGQTSGALLPANAHVTNADVAVFPAWAANCSATPVYMYPITGYWPPTSGNYPYPQHAPNWVAQGAVAGGQNCGSASLHYNLMNIGYSPSALDALNQWTQDFTTNHGLLLVTDNTNSGDYKRFVSADNPVSDPPYMNIYYTTENVAYSYPQGNPVWNVLPTAVQGGQLPVTVSNIGMSDWSAGDALGYHIYADPGVRNITVSESMAAALPNSVPAYQHPAASVTVNATLPAVPVGTYEVCWDMMMADHATFWSRQSGAPISCMQMIVKPTGPVFNQINGMSPGDGYTVGMLNPVLSTSWYEGDGANPGNVSYAWQVCPVDGNGNPACPSQTPAVTQNRWFIASVLTGTTTPLAWGQTYAWNVKITDGQGITLPSPWSSFVTQVPQPVVTSHLGGDSYDGSGKTVDPQIGNFVEPVTDARIATFGPPLAVARTYNSLDPRQSLSFGSGWASVLDSSAAALSLENKDVVITYPSGEQVRFGANADGTYAAPPGRSGTVSAVSSGGYTLTDTDGTVYSFTAVARGTLITMWRLSKISDAQGRTQTFSWTDSTHLTVTAANGRHLYFTFATPSGASAAHVSSVSTDPTAGTGTALTWTYGYVGDQLRTVCPPTSATACTAYSYVSTGSHYSSAVLDGNPEAYWRLGDVAAGTGAHDEVVANAGADNGSYGGGVSPGADSAVPGGGSASFDGSSGFVAAPNGLIQGKSYVAVQLWFKTTSRSAGMLFSTGNSPAGAANPSGAAMPVMYVGTDGYLHAHFWDGTVSGMASGSTVNDGRWHQAVLSAEGNVQDLYLDGKLQVQQSNGNPLDNIDPIDLIGTGVFNGNGWPAAPGGNTWGYFNGEISEVSFYDHPVSDYTVAQQYNAVATPSLTKVTTAAGKVSAQVAYDGASGRVTSVTDFNGGTWKYGTPQPTGQSASYNSAVMATSPVAYWPLTEAGAGPAENLINSQKAFYNNVNQASPNVFGDGNASVFNGSNSYVATTGSKPVLDTAQSYTVSAWAQLSSTPGSGNYELVSEDGNTASGFMFGFDHACSCYWAYLPGADAANVGGPTITSPSSVVQLGTWTHFALTYDAAAQTATFYVNGKPVGTAGVIGWTASGAFTIGRAEYNGTAVDYWPGVIGDVAVSRKALSQSAIAALYQAFDPTSSAKQTTVNVTDPGGNTLSYVYDPARGGRVLAVSDGTGRTTRYGYDAMGFADTVTDANGDIVSSGHDQHGNVVSTTTCKDLAGADCFTSYANYTLVGGGWKLTDSMDGRSSGPADTRYDTKYTYNTSGAAIGQTATVVTPATPDFPSGRISSYAYTTGSEAAVCPLGVSSCTGTQPAGMLAKTVDPAGLTTLFAYDALGELTKQTDPSGLVTVYAYDGIGRRIGTKQISDTFPNGVETDTVLDGLSRPVQVTGPMVTDRVTGAVHQQQTTTIYDADGDATSVTVSDAKGVDPSRQVQRTYDAYDRVQTETDPMGGKTTYGYDGFGNRTSVTDPMNVETDYSYDADGRLLTTTLQNWTGDPTSPSAATDLTLESRAYDPAGRLASVTDAMGRETAYQYYDDNRLYQTALDNFHNPDGTFRKIVQQDNWYDGAGEVYKSTQGDTIRETDNVFDAAGRLTSSTFDKTGIDKVTTYTYDADGNVLTATATGAGSASLPVAGGPAHVARTASASSATGGTSIPMAVTTAAKAGDAVLVSMMLTNVKSGTPTVIDTQGNVYTKVVDEPDGAGDRTLTFAALGIKALSTTDKITVAAPTNSEYHVVAEEFSGVTAVDQTAVNTHAAGVPWSAGPTGTTSQATELLYGVAGIQGGSGTVWGSGFTGTPTLFLPGATSGDQLATGYQVVTATGQYTAGGTATKQWMAGIVTLKSAGAGGSVAIGQPVTFAGATEKATDTYDAAERLASTSVTSAAGVATTSYGYDQRGLVTSRVDPRGNAAGAQAAAYTTATSYDEVGRAVISTGAAVNAETNGSAPISVHPTTVTGYNTFGETAETKDPDGAISSTAYDLDGRATVVSAPAYTPPGSTTALQPRVTAKYNADGQVYQRLDALGNPTSFTLDQRGRVWAKTDPPINGGTGGGVTHYSLDDDGETLAVTDPTGAVGQSTYDDLGRRITSTDVVRTPATAAYTTSFTYDDASNMTNTTSAAGVVTTMTYDMAGDLLTSQDAVGDVSRFRYDLDKRVVDATDPMGLSTVAVYDAAGHRTAMAQLDTAGNVVRADSAGYDLAGNRTSVTDWSGATTTTGYDAGNRVVQQVEPVTSGHTITTGYGYDADGRRTRFTDGRADVFLTGYNTLGLAETRTEPATTAYPNASDRTWTTSYDADGRPVTVTEPGNVVRTSTYDALGDLTRQTGTGAEAATADHTYSYDLAGRLLGVAAPGAADSFAYDDRGLLLSTAGASGASSFAYDGDGRMTSRTDASGVSTYGYDAAGRLGSIADAGSGSQITYGYTKNSQFATATYGTGGDVRSFGYDNLSRLTSDKLTTSGGATVGSITYGYNADDSITSKTTTGFAGAGANTYGYDQAGRLTSWNNGTSTVAYTYDDAGNRTGIGSRTLSYDARNRLTGDGVTSYTYSARGTRTGTTTGGATVTSTFDAFDRMVGDGSTTYTYDGLDRMIGAGTTTLAYTGQGNDIASDGTTAYSRDPAGGLVGLAQGGVKGLAWTDQHDDLVATFTAAGPSLTGSTTFDPLGTPLASGGAKTALGYQSGWTDPGSGKTNMAARWYDPTSGQFTSRDSWGLSPNPVSGNANAYGYGNGDPLGSTDPSGHDPSGITTSPKCLLWLAWCVVWDISAATANANLNILGFNTTSTDIRDPGPQACQNVTPADDLFANCLEYGYEPNYQPQQDTNPADLSNDTVCTGLTPGTKQFYYYGCGPRPPAPPTSHQTTPCTHGILERGICIVIPVCVVTCPVAAGPVVATPVVLAPLPVLAPRPVDPGSPIGTGNNHVDPVSDPLPTEGPGTDTQPYHPDDQHGRGDENEPVSRPTRIPTCLDFEPPGATSLLPPKDTSSGTESGWVLYISDSQGRNKEALACMAGKTSGDRGQSAGNANIQGWKDAKDRAKVLGFNPPGSFIARCHSIPNEAGGTRDRRNLTPCFQQGANTNQSTGGVITNSMRTFEKKAGALMNNNQAVVYDVTMQYIGTNKIPWAYDMSLFSQDRTTGIFTDFDKTTVENSRYDDAGHLVNLGY